MGADARRCGPAAERVFQRLTRPWDECGGSRRGRSEKEAVRDGIRARTWERRAWQRGILNAAGKGSAEEVGELLRQGIDPGTRDRKGRDARPHRRRAAEGIGQGHPRHGGRRPGSECDRPGGELGAPSCRPRPEPRRPRRPAGMRREPCAAERRGADAAGDSRASGVARDALRRDVPVHLQARTDGARPARAGPAARHGRGGCGGDGHRRRSRVPHAQPPAAQRPRPRPSVRGRTSGHRHFRIPVPERSGHGREDGCLPDRDRPDRAAQPPRPSGSRWAGAVHGRGRRAHRWRDLGCRHGCRGADGSAGPSRARNVPVACGAFRDRCARNGLPGPSRQSGGGVFPTAAGGSGAFAPRRHERWTGCFRWTSTVPCAIS